MQLVFRLQTLALRRSRSADRDAIYADFYRHHEPPQTEVFQNLHDLLSYLRRFVMHDSSPEQALEQMKHDNKLRLTILELVTVY
jgi:hypothetical protein